MLKYGWGLSGREGSSGRRAWRSGQLSGEVAVDIDFASEDERAAAWFSSRGGRDKLPCAELELAVRETVIYFGPLLGIVLSECVLNRGRVWSRLRVMKARRDSRPLTSVTNATFLFVGASRWNEESGSKFYRRVCLRVRRC